MTTIDDYVVDTLMRDLVGHDRHPSAFLVYLYLWRAAEREGGDRCVRSLRDVGHGTGLSRRAVQDALRRLEARRLLEVRRRGVTAVPEYTVLRPWARGQ